MQSELDDVAGLAQLMSQGLALGIIPENDPNRRLLINSLGDYHDLRFSELGKLEDLEKVIEYRSRTLNSTPADSPDLPDVLSSLGNSCAQRFKTLGEVDDVEQAVKYLSRALALTPDGDPELPNRLANLGLYHSFRFQSLGQLDDLKKAIELKSRAVDLTPNDHPELANRLGNLGISYGDRFQRLGDLTDLEKAIKCEDRSLALTPDDHPDFSDRLTNIGASHLYRFKYLGDLSDLEKAIEYGSRAINLAPEGQSELPTRLANLGVAYSERFQRSGGLDDLENSIVYKSRAVSLTPSGHPELSSRFANLGVSYSDRFQRFGRLEDLDNAINYEYRAVGLTPHDHPGYSGRLANLGVSYIYRYQLLGEFDDLEKALFYESRALALTPDDHPDLIMRLCNLGASHNSRFEHLGELDDLMKGIRYGSRGVALAPDGHPFLSNLLSNLGLSYSSRYRCSGNIADLKKSITCESRALIVTPNGHSYLPIILSNLGSSQIFLFQRLKEVEDLKRAIKYESQALALTPSEHPSSASMQNQLAISLLFYYEHTREPSHLQNSLDYFRKASQSSTGAPRLRFSHAVQWAEHASNYPSLNCIEAYQTAIDLLPQFIWLGTTTSQRYEDLSTAEGLAVSAACAAIRSSQCKLALEWLEHARCVVWNQGLMLRSPLDQLQSSHPILASRLQTVANQLHHASTVPRESQAFASVAIAPESIAQRHHRLAQEYNELLSQAREKPGFRDFLRPIKANSLTRAARCGPIIVLDCHKSYCDALVILPGREDVDHIPLPKFTEEKARKACSAMTISLRRRGLRERGFKLLQEPGNEANIGRVLSALWYGVVHPLLDFLGYIKDAPKTNLPHITWCPTGAMSFLPWHAAGDYGQPGSRIFDHAISSYTPTLTALLTSNPSPLTRDSRVLGIGLEVTPGHSPLSGTSGELASVKTHVQNIAQYTQLMNEQATTTATLEAMEQHDWVHIACHAHQNVADPTKSGFFLHDGTLDLASINRRSFKRKGLAFLSACQTATGDEKLPDEAIHLASGMLMAGYSSVIATMWSVVDEDAPLIADKVYEELMKDGKLGSGEAGKALHNAVGNLRGKVGEKAFERWVPYIHIGS